MKKIYSDDPLVSYKGTTVNADRTKQLIDAKLREYGVKDIHWHWKPEANDIYVQFQIEEIIEGLPVKVIAKVRCPSIWDKAKPRSPIRANRVEKVNLDVSMRVMHWYIKTHLESSYAMQSSHVAGFLPDIVTHTGETYFDALKSRVTDFPALTSEPQKKHKIKIVNSLEEDQS